MVKTILMRFLRDGSRRSSSLIIGLLLLNFGPLRAQELHSSTQTFAEIDRLYFNRHEPGHLESSIAFLEGRLRENPKEGEALWRLARSLVRFGERQKKTSQRIPIFEKSRALAESAVAAVPKEPEAHFWLGLAMGRLGEARGMLRSLFLVGPLKRRMRRVLELNPRHSGAHHVLGEMLRQLPGFAGGSKTQAVLELETALRLSPKDTKHYPALAEAYLALGEREKAKAVLGRIFEVTQPEDPGEYPDNIAEARRMLQTLGN